MWGHLEQVFVPLAPGNRLLLQDKLRLTLAVGTGAEDRERWFVRRCWERNSADRGGRGSAFRCAVAHWILWNDLVQNRLEAMGFHDAKIQPGPGTCG